MKTRISFNWLIPVLMVANLTAIPVAIADNHKQTNIDSVKKEASELLDALKTYSANQRDQAIKETRAALDKLDKRIESLETRINKNWDNMSQAARHQARNSLQTLRKQRIQVAEWYGSLKASSDNAWQHMKQGFSQAYEAVTDAWSQAEQEFSQPEEKQ